MFVGSWISLGGMRGAQLYEKDKIDFNETHVNSTKLKYCMFGALVYMNPLLLPTTVNKEIGRLETYIRDLDEEDDHYELI